MALSLRLARETVKRRRGSAPHAAASSGWLLSLGQKTVALFKKVNSRFPVIVGGAPVTEEFANVIGADGYGENAPHAVENVHRLVAGQAAAA